MFHDVASDEMEDFEIFEEIAENQKNRVFPDFRVLALF